MNNNKGQKEFVDCSLEIGTDTANIDVSFGGSYPLQIRDHTIFLLRERDEMRFFCTICEEEICFSESMWRLSSAEDRRRATKYALGSFYEATCRPEEVSDIVSYVVGDYLGTIATKETVRMMEEDLRMELMGDV